MIMTFHEVDVEFFRPVSGGDRSSNPASLLAGSKILAPTDSKGRRRSLPKLNDIGVVSYLEGETGLSIYMTKDCPCRRRYRVSKFSNSQPLSTLVGQSVERRD